MLDKILKLIKLSNHVDQPLDKIQLDAAQDRFHHRSTELNQSVDELTNMLKRMKKSTKGRK